MSTSYTPVVGGSRATTMFQPLATVFTPSSRCYTRVTSNRVDGNEAFFIKSEQYGTDGSDTLRCLPTEVDISRFASYEPGTTTLLGPFVCPFAFTQISSQVISSFSTRTICCPSGFSPGVSGSGYDQGCTSLVAPNVPFETLDGTYSNPTWSVNDIVTLYASALTGWNLDQKAAAAAATSSIAASTISSASTSADLSTPAKIGIGVGAGVGGVLLVLLFVLYCVWSRKMQRQTGQKPIDAAEDDAVATMPLEMASTSVVQPSELHANNQSAQLDAHPLPHELHATSHIGELHGSYIHAAELGTARQVAELHGDSWTRQRPT